MRLIIQDIRTLRWQFGYLPGPRKGGIIFLGPGEKRDSGFILRTFLVPVVAATMSARPGRFWEGKPAPASAPAPASKSTTTWVFLVVSKGALSDASQVEEGFATGNHLLLSGVRESSTTPDVPDVGLQGQNQRCSLGQPSPCHCICGDEADEVLLPFVLAIGRRLGESITKILPCLRWPWLSH